MKYAILILAGGLLASGQTLDQLEHLPGRNMTAQALLPSPPAAPAAAELAARIKRGMARWQVHDVAGRLPDRYFGYTETHRVNHGDSAEAYHTPKNDLVVFYKNDKAKAVAEVSPANVESFVITERPAKPETAYDAGPSTVEHVANMASGIYLSAVCPRVYQKPVIWMNAGELQLLQTCNANGFMLFGAYFYTGPK